MSLEMHAQSISVIVPLYNVERYVRVCVESVLAQTYPHWELLLVDDGSTDSTPQLCDELATSDTRINVFHKPNGGPSEARNYGLDRAQGDFLVFLDGDDMLAPEAMRNLLEEYNRSEAPVVAGGFIKVREDCAFAEASRLLEKSRARKESDATAVVDDADEAIIENLYQRRDHSPWGKLYRRDVWRTLRFREGTIYEDLDIFYHVYRAAGKVAFIPATVCFYRQRPTSFMHAFDLRRADVLDVTDRLLEWSRRQCREIERAAQCRRLSAHCNILGLLMARSCDSLPAEKREQILLRCREVILADGVECARNPLAPRKIKSAMRLLRVAGFKIFSFLLSLNYRK